MAIIKTASEIVYNSQVMANVFNLDFQSFQSMITNLNSIYRTLYSDIANSDSDYYVKEFIFRADSDAKGVPLPCDLYMIKSVSYVNSDNRTTTVIDRCPSKEEVAGTYRIENNRFYLYGMSTRDIKIRYVPTPQTITAPRQSELIDLDPDTIKKIGRMTEEGFYYTDIADINHFYDFDSLETSLVEGTLPVQDTTYDGHELTFDVGLQTVMWGETDVSNYFYNNGIKFIDIVWDSPYMMVTYEDYSIKIYNYFDRTDWNIKASTGHKTEGAILAIRTNDRTGWGCVYQDKVDEKLYRASFVPDTVLDYPTNAFFYLMECALANLLMSIAGLQNSYISSVLTTQAENEFVGELRQNRAQPLRMSNQGAYSRNRVLGRR